jgi:hypothetical protein
MASDIGTTTPRSNHLVRLNLVSELAAEVDDMTDSW